MNPSMLDVFTLAHFSVEFDVTGAVYPRSRIHQYRLFRDPQIIEKQKQISNDHPAVILYYIFIAMTAYNLLVELDQFFTSVYNQEYVHVWPRIHFPGFVSKYEFVEFISLSDYLRETLQVPDGVNTKSIPVSLRLAAAVAKTTFDDIPDQDAVLINIRWPWKTDSGELDEVELYPADRYLTFMERLSMKCSKDQPMKMLQGNITLKIESSIIDSEHENKSIIVDSNDSINDLYLLLFSGFHPVYRFKKKPNVVTVMLTFIVAKSDGEKEGWFLIKVVWRQMIKIEFQRMKCRVLTPNQYLQWMAYEKHIAARMSLRYECVDLVLESGERITDGVALSDVGLYFGIGEDAKIGSFSFAQSGWNNIIFRICRALYICILLLPADM